MSASPDARLDIVTYRLDPWKAVAEHASSLGRTDIIDEVRKLERENGPDAPTIGFEIALQERSFSGEPVSDGCQPLWSDFGVFYQPREAVRPLRDRPPSELAAKFLFCERSALSVDALCQANALLGGPGSLRSHEHRSSRYPSGQRSVYTPAAKVREQTEYLVAQINDAPHLDPFAFAATAMLHCLVVHPFSDANGRLSFVLFQYCLFRKGLLTVPLVPLGPFLEKHRSEYLYALVAFSLAQTINPFCDLLARAAVATVRATSDLAYESPGQVTIA